MRAMKTLAGAGALLLAGLALACSPGGDAWVVEIDDGGVRLAELEAVLEERVQEEGPERRDDLLHEELDRLVAEHVVQKRAEKLGIEITDADVDAWLRSIHGEDFTPEDPAYRDAVRRELTAERAALVDLAERIHVPDDDVIAWFEEHRDEYQQPARVQIRQIVIDTEGKALQIRSELREGIDFATAAEAHSLAPEAAQGGLLPPFAKGELPDVFDRAFEMELDEVSPVLHSPYGYHIFKLVARFPPLVPELADVRERIVAELETQRLVELKREWLRDLRRSAEIRVNERALEALK